MTPPRVLLVDDDPAMLATMDRLLGGLGRLAHASDGASALRAARDRTPDLVLLDAEMPGMNGFQVFQAMQADPRLRHVPVVFVSAHDEDEFAVQGLDLGAVDVIAKPFSAPALVLRVKACLAAKRQHDDLRDRVPVDPDTRLAKRGRFDVCLDTEWRRARRAATPLSVLLVETDLFDHLGAGQASDWLHAIGLTLGVCVDHPGDLAARMATSQFALLLPDTGRDGALHVARRVRDAVQALADPEVQPDDRVHFTLGLGCYDEDSPCWTEPSADSRFAPIDTLLSAGNLCRAAETALQAARRDPQARAWFMDLADVDAPALAQAVAWAPAAPAADLLH